MCSRNWDFSERQTGQIINPFVYPPSHSHLLKEKIQLFFLQKFSTQLPKILSSEYRREVVYNGLHTTGIATAGPVRWNYTHNRHTLQEQEWDWLTQLKYTGLMMLLLKTGQGFLHNDRYNIIMEKPTVLALFLIREGGCYHLRETTKCRSTLQTGEAQRSALGVELSAHC